MLLEILDWVGYAFLITGGLFTIISIFASFASSNDSNSTPPANNNPAVLTTPQDTNILLLVSQAKELYLHLVTLNRNIEVIGVLDKYDEEFKNVNGLPFALDARIAHLALLDVMQCYEKLGYGLDLYRDEGLGMIAFCLLLVNGDHNINEYAKKSVLLSKRQSVASFIASTKRASESSKLPEGKFVLLEILRNEENIDRSLLTQYAVLLYRFASLLAKTDGTVTETESQWLSHIMQFTTIPSPTERVPKKVLVSPTSTTSTPPPTTSSKQPIFTGDALKRLDELIGLAPVKEEVHKMTDFIKVQQLRKQKGLKTSPLSYHCVFTGNPGTGKTTVARIVAEIYRDLGILQKGHLVETDRSGLVAEYVGQTAVKTNKIIDSALDGVLFIDEAYSLVQGGGNDYGMEAIATLLKRMEDDRERLVVILAGYGNEMQKFIDSNPGLQSRFNRYIHFIDYTAEDLMKIFQFNIKKYDYVLSDEARQKLQTLFDEAVAHKDKNFGNGRFARNILEKVLENQATRLATIGNISDKMLRTIEPQDIM